MTKKSFFEERSAKEIKKLEVRNVQNSRGLVEKLLSLSPEKEALALFQPLLPPKILNRDIPQFESARQLIKHGTVIPASQPLTQRDALQSREIPLAIRKRDLDKLRSEREETIFDVGYTWLPIQGPDKRLRRDLFCFVPESLRIFSYAESITGGITVTPYADARKAAKEGARVVCTVPSRTRKQSRYQIELVNVPIHNTEERKAVPWGLRAEYGKDGEPGHKTFNFGFRLEDDRTSSDDYTFYPHERAAYLAVAASFWRNEHNLVPLEMSPFMLLSKQAAELYRRAKNNLLIFDPTLDNPKDRLRKPYLAELSVLMARCCGVLGHDNTFFWDWNRDGKIKDYNWSIPK